MDRTQFARVVGDENVPIKIDVWGIRTSVTPGISTTYAMGDRPAGEDMRPWGGIEYIGHYEWQPEHPQGLHAGRWVFVRDNFRALCLMPTIAWQEAHCPEPQEGFVALGFL